MKQKSNYFNTAVSAIRPSTLNKMLNYSTGKNIKVAVVDSGWNYSLNDFRVVKGIGFASRQSEFELCTSNDYNDKIGHGTAVTDIILQIAPDVSIHPIRVFDKKLETSISILVEAVKWSIKNKMDIINFSLGTLEKEHLEPLYKICEIAHLNNIIIVASKSNSNEWSYPAIFENSIGVASNNFQSCFDYQFLKDEAIECVSKGYQQWALWKDGERKYLSGNSFAAPNITGIVALLLELNPKATLEEIRKSLMKFAIKNKKATHLK